MAVTYDITADQGANLHLSFRWRQPRTVDQVTDGEPGTPVDLTGYTARMQVRRTLDAPEVLLELTTSGTTARIVLGAVTPDDTPVPASGIVTLWVEATPMESIPAGSFVYDLEMVSPSGFVTRFVEGKLKVLAEVTRVTPPPEEPVAP